MCRDHFPFTFAVFSAVAFALALYAFMKLHGQECHYACPEISQPICAYQKEEQMRNQAGGMNFSSVCNRDMYNCQNPSHSKEKLFQLFHSLSLFLIVTLIIFAGFGFYTKGSCSDSNWKSFIGLQYCVKKVTARDENKILFYDKLKVFLEILIHKLFRIFIH